MRLRRQVVFSVICAGLLALILMDVGRLVLAQSRQASIDAVRVRNALVAELGTPQETDWPPSAVPANFVWESENPSSYVAKIVDGVLPPETDGLPVLERALRLAHHIRVTSARGAPIQSNIRETYEKITAGKGGYCSDYTQTFNALALAAGLAVREWGFAWEDMANGHAFNEVWDPDLQKWLFIDSFVSFYVVDSVSGAPLSAMEFRDHLLGEGGPEAIDVVPIVPERFGFKSVEKALNWYRRGLPRMFLLLGNNAYSYDTNPFIKFAERLPRSVEMMVAILLGEHPRFLFVPSEMQPEVRGQVEDMIWERVWLLVKLGGMVVLGFALLLSLRQLVRSRSSLVSS